MTLPSGVRSRRFYHEKYPEGTPEVMNFPRLESAYRELGWRVCSEEVGSVLETQNKYSFACHLNGEKMSFVYYEAVRGKQRAGQ